MHSFFYISLVCPGLLCFYHGLGGGNPHNLLGSKLRPAEGDDERVIGQEIEKQNSTHLVNLDRVKADEADFEVTFSCR